MGQLTATFLYQLLNCSSPSGFEVDAARTWQAEARTFADAVTSDTNGNSFARLTGDRPRVMLVGHLDEIGIVVHHIDDHGFCWFRLIGAWDEQVLVGQRVRLNGPAGTVVGVVGKKSPWHMEPDERDKPVRSSGLWIDIGARNAQEARALVALGTSGIVEQPVIQLGQHAMSGRGLDNRIGAFAALEALRELAIGERPLADVWAVAGVQEELVYFGIWGAMTSAYQVEPDVAIVIDVANATDYPGVDHQTHGLYQLGAGPILPVGSAVNPAARQALVDAAEAEHIPYQVAVAPSLTGTDADAIARVRAGIPTAVVEVPVRYAHTPNEMASLSDLDHAVRLVTACVRRLGADTRFLRT
jgi:endoglucanase